MAKRDPRVDEYIEKSVEFARPILKHLRRVGQQRRRVIASMIPRWSGR